MSYIYIYIYIYIYDISNLRVNRSCVPNPKIKFSLLFNTEKLRLMNFALFFSNFLGGHSEDWVENWIKILKQILKERLSIMTTGWARYFAHYMIIFQSLTSNISSVINCRKTLSHYGLGIKLRISFLFLFLRQFSNFSNIQSQASYRYVEHPVRERKRFNDIYDFDRLLMVSPLVPRI